MPRAVEALAAPSVFLTSPVHEVIRHSVSPSGGESSTHSSVLFIGSSVAAKDSDWLVASKVHFVLNCAAVEDVIVPKDLYSQLDIQWLQLEDLFDNTSCDISPYFDRCIKEINRRLKDGESVLVHCRSGKSRSASIVLAYLMASRGMSLVEGVMMLREKRPVVYPNKAFFLSLIHLEKRLCGPGQQPSMKPEMIELHEDPTPVKWLNVAAVDRRGDPEPFRAGE
uniref:protein-tyrosine-phosphatase n=1 Tax=Chromera velia CCMP2878 TaxID=1169474 RepID=A0A0G4HRF3_9ALVE|eukprot:Cvel_8111.t1-p1 / transcript=Cvel_8111.t1 / gene=Cvel_8111 / organism=Chromera_velia_CCMP2878 / gene_product=Dual specificity protein phosphatase 1B, putative / transcript_product=Dual specificity protein phosphatase 1B, putative / location=Cvel_scaffold441:24630-25298(+) / protein_length=223 / sequence_SO=supercontig / SO=protein_coding / is_pseudo=false